MMDAWQWLEQVRGLDPELMTRLGVRVRGDDVAIPYVRRGSTYGHKFRSAKDKRFWWKPEGATKFLWNRDVLDDKALFGAPIIITEGEIDAISVMQAGFARVVSLPDGWSENSGDVDGAKMRPLVEAVSALRESPCVIVAGDMDAPGQALIRAVGGLLEGHPVRHVCWPEECKDANDTLRQHGESEVVRLIEAARLLNPPGGEITGFSDLPPLPARRVLRPGYQPFDKVAAFEIGAMSVITGIPGHGKSTFATWIAHHVVRNEGIMVGYMGFETHPHRTRDHLCRLNTGKTWDSLTGSERTNLEAVLDKHWRIVHRTFADGVDHQMGWLRSMVHTLAVRDRCKLIIVDPWNELEHMPREGESMTAYLNWAIKEIRTWAEHWDCHICLVAHPRKIGQDGKVYPPNGYDIADSAAWANKPSLGLTVFQDDSADPHVKLRVWKVRDTQLYGFGKGTAEVDFDQDGMCYRRRA